MRINSAKPLYLIINKTNGYIEEYMKKMNECTKNI